MASNPLTPLQQARRNLEMAIEDYVVVTASRRPQTKRAVKALIDNLIVEAQLAARKTAK